jgi:hypothetical protein
LKAREPDAVGDKRSRALSDDREVAIWALARDRLGVQAPTGDEEVEGFEEARNRARELAGV